MEEPRQDLVSVNEIHREIRIVQAPSEQLVWPCLSRSFPFLLLSVLAVLQVLYPLTMWVVSWPSSYPSNR